MLNVTYHTKYDPLAVFKMTRTSAVYDVNGSRKLYRNHNFREISVVIDKTNKKYHCSSVNLNNFQTLNTLVI